LGGPKILIADENVFSVRVLQRLLSREGYHLNVVSSTKRLLTFYPEFEPDLILIDADLPGDGFAACRALKQTYGAQCASIIFFTLRAEAEDVVAGVAAGAVDYLRKPFNAAEVKARIRAQLEHRQLVARHGSLLAELRQTRAEKHRLQSLVTESLRVPLASIRMLSHFLHSGRLGPLPPDRRELAEKIHASSRPLRDRVDDVLRSAAIPPPPAAGSPDSREGETSPAPPSGSAGTLLVADDEPPAILLLALGLREEGYRVFEARSGAEALALYPEIEPDLVVLDASMPHMNGHEACRRLVTTHRDRCAPILFHTGRFDASEITAAFEAGATDYLVKPASLSEIRARVRAHVQNRALAKEEAKLVAELRHERETISRSIQMVTHDLRAPLGSIREWAESLLQGSESLPTEQRGVVSIVHSTSELMLKTVDELTSTKSA
jgi:DNA-binding response OmpR family regulator